MAKPNRNLLAYNDKDQFTTYMEINGHSLIADEPVDIGGDNKGPDPFAFILAGLSSCITITLRMYIQRKKMDVDRIAVDATLNEDKEISVTMEIEGNITDKERERLAQIADMCPVHKYLKTEATITKKMV